MERLARGDRRLQAGPEAARGLGKVSRRRARLFYLRRTFNVPGSTGSPHHQGRPPQRRPTKEGDSSPSTRRLLAPQALNDYLPRWAVVTARRDISLATAPPSSRSTSRDALLRRGTLASVTTAYGQATPPRHALLGRDARSRTAANFITLYCIHQGPSDRLEGDQMTPVGVPSAQIGSMLSPTYNQRDRISLLPTAIVVCNSNADSWIQLRALLDPAAECSFLTERVVQALGLTKKRANIPISGVGGEVATTSKFMVEVGLRSLHHPNFYLKFSARVLSKLTSKLPKSRCRDEGWSHLGKLQLADPEFLSPAGIHCILGAEVYPALIRSGLRRTKVGPGRSTNRVRLGLHRPSNSLFSRQHGAQLLYYNRFS